MAGIYGQNPPALESYDASSYTELIRLSGNVLNELKDWSAQNGYWHTPDVPALLKNCPNALADVTYCLIGAVVITVVRLALCRLLMNKVSSYRD